MENAIIIFNGRIAKQLIQTKRFVLEDINVDKKDGVRTIFFFENTEELREHLKNDFNIIIK